MANRTVKDAKSVRGTNPQYLVEKIIRSRIYDCKYWKEECFALSAELLVDKAMELRYLGGVYGGNIKPTPFLCLVLKMLQIQPEKDIIVEFIKNEEFKYVRALGAMYMRLVGTSLDCYKYLEPLFNDSRKLRRQNRQGQFELVYMDEFIDELLREERLCDVILPRVQKRHVLEENNELEPKISALEDDLDEAIESSGDEEEVVKPPEVPVNVEPHWPRGREDKVRRPSPLRRRSTSRERNRDRERRRSRDRERNRPDREKKTRRSRSRERRHRSKDRDQDRVRDQDRGREQDRMRDQDRMREQGRARPRHRDL
ncbi:Pre-mRNA-splicing factor 38A [Cryptotermes secundus]|uniref:Pre-mRNA-splicing factor 38 n=1 Tax=Cryptotermes secundus TaxID=105785 RepID=A0A2J7Q9H0_9NEOP|nr:Pre-mRNA-splicing factor 38A [Cryptotermes secundus]